MRLVANPYDFVGSLERVSPHSLLWVEKESLVGNDHRLVCGEARSYPILFLPHHLAYILRSNLSQSSGPLERLL